MRRAGWRADVIPRFHFSGEAVVVPHWNDPLI
jgi:hypothetical protein